MDRLRRDDKDSDAPGSLPVKVETPQGHDIGRIRADVDGDGAANRIPRAGGPGRARDGDRKGDGDRAELAGIEAVDLAARSRLGEGPGEGLAGRGAAAGVGVVARA